MAEQESRLAIVIDTAGAEARIKALKEQLKDLGGAADNAADDTADLGNSADRASRDTNRLNASAANGEKALDKMGKAAAVAGALLAGGLALSVNKAQSWETALSEINKTVDFASSDGLANMRKELQALTLEIPQTFEELAAVTATGGQLGIAEKDLIHFTKVMAKMGVAFDIPAQQAADSMAKIANVFQIPIASIDGLGDAINTLSNNTPATAAQLIDSLQRVGGVAKVFGLSADATLGLTGALIAMGKPAEVASTAVNSLLTTFSTLDNATKSQYIGFEQLGLDIDKFSKLVKTDGKQAIIEYLEAINQLDQSERIGTNALIVGKEFGDDITMLAGSVGVLENNWAMLGETVNTTKDYFGSMDVEFDKISATSANKMVLFKNNIDGVVASVGDAFIPALNNLLLAMTPMIAAIGTWAASNPELIQQIVVIGGSLLTAVVSMKLFADGVNAAKTTIDGLKFAYTALSSPMALTIIALGALLVAGVLVYQNWEVIKKTISENKLAFGLLAGVIAGVSAALLIVNANLIITTGLAYAQAAGTAIMSAATAVWSVAAGVAAAATWAFNGALAVLTSPILAVVAAIALIAVGGYLVVKNWSAISAGLRAEFEKIKAGVMSAVNSMQAAWDNAVARTRAAFINIGNTISTTLRALPSKMLTIGKQIVDGLVNGIKNGASAATNAIVNMASSVVNAAKSVLQIRSPSRVMTKIGKHTADGMAKGIRSGRKTVKSEAQKMAEDAIKATQDGIKSLERELRLFGNASPVAAIDDDIKQGKYSGDTGRLRNLTSELESKKQVAEINREIAGYGKIIYDNSMLNPNELTKISYELDNANGKYFSINEEAKKLLRTNAAMADEQKLLASATQVLLSGTRELALLETDGSAYSQLAYDLYDASNAMFDLSDAVKTQMLIQAGAIEQAKKSKAANDSITTSLNSIHKELSLLGDNSALAELMYDLNQTDKYAGAAADKFQELVDAVTKLDNIKRGDALTSVMDELAQESPLDKIEADYQRRLEAINDYESQWTDLLGVHSAERTAIEQSYMDAKQQLMLGQSEAMFGALAGMSKGFLGEQSVVYRGLYALEKAYTLSSALLGSKKAIMDAWANTPGGYFAKSFAVGKVVLSTSAITSAIAGLSPKGFKAGGYTGNMGASQVAGVVHGQEYVFDAQSTKNIGVDNLNAMRSGKMPSNGASEVNITVNVDAQGNSSMSGDQSNAVGKQIAAGTKALVMDILRKEKRQGGLLYA